MLVRELVFSILDLAKAATSDDSYWTEDHIIFLTKKYRSFLIKKEQDKEKNSEERASEAEYQQICLDLEKVPAIDGEPCTGGYYLRTTKEVPNFIEGYKPRVYPVDYFQGINISYISRDRMRYVGTNPYLQNILYVALGPNSHLYLNSSNPQFLYLRQIRVNAVFDDFDKAAELLCDDDCKCPCDVLDMEFPMRDYLVPPLIELVVKELAGSFLRKPDEVNNAKDDTPDLNRRQ